MVKKIIPLDSYVSAHDFAQLLSLKHDRPIDPKYIRLALETGQESGSHSAK